MTEVLATGPMKIPGRITGDPVGAPPNAVHVSIKNPTSKDFRIQLFAEVCDSTGPETLFPVTVQVVPDNSCLTRTFTFDGLAQPGDILRFFALEIWMRMERSLSCHSLAKERMIR